jgi:hypothetical protein
MTFQGQQRLACGHVPQAGGRHPSIGSGEPSQLGPKATPLIGPIRLIESTLSIESTPPTTAKSSWVEETSQTLAIPSALAASNRVPHRFVRSSGNRTHSGLKATE